MAQLDKTYDLFISYAREDHRFVDRLAEQLDRRGYTVFVDREEVRGGEAWRARIVEALSASRTLIVVLSPAFAASHMVTKEMALAREAGTRFLPILVEPVTLPPNKIFYVNGINYLDFTRSYDEGMKELLAVLPPPASSGKVLKGKARGAAKIGLYSAGGLLGAAVLALLCYGAYLLAQAYPGIAATPTPLLSQPVPQQSSLVQSAEPAVVATPAAQIPDSVPPDVQQAVANLLSQAAAAEIQAYAHQDAGYVSAVYTGNALAQIQENINTFSALGWVSQATFYPESSRILTMSFLDSQTLLVETCEAWSAAVYEVATSSLVQEIPLRVIANQLTLVYNPTTGWIVTEIFQPEPPNFCS